MKKIFLLILLSGALAGVYAQQVVTGVVKDGAHGLQGASVIQKGQPNVGVITDANGRFTLTLRGGSDSIIVQSVGFLSQELKASRSLMAITLKEDVKGLEDVIVVAYGAQKKITVTGAASTISGKSIRENPSASLQNTLMGKLPGFTSQQRSGRPGGDGAEFYIRGQSTFNGSNTPLIVVDDIEFTADQFARLDPNEIESVTILKDASMTAVYGIKGANGVVVVKTQRGRIGKPSVTIRTEYSLTQPTILPDYLGSYDVSRLMRQAQINDNVYAPNPTFKPYFSEQDVQLFKDGTDPYGHPDNNWKDILFKEFAGQQRVNVDVSGGTEKVKYFISVGYINQEGMLRDFGKSNSMNNNYFNHRYNYRSNLDISVNKRMDLRIDVYGNVSQINNPAMGGPFNFNDVFWEVGAWRGLTPFNYPVYNPNGTYGMGEWNRSVNGNNYNVNNIVGRLSLAGYNRDFEDNMNLNATLSQKLDMITKGLSVRGVVAYASAYSYRRSLTRTPNAFPSFLYNSTTDTYQPRDVNQQYTNRPGVGYDPRSTVRTLSMQGILNYDRSFHDHHLSGLALVNQKSVLRADGNAAYNFVPSNFRGFTMRMSYDYKNKYLLQVSSAYNGTDRFVGKKRFGLFPAVSAGWNIAEENFIKNHVKDLDQLKIRGSYGLVGSDASAAYSYVQTYGEGNGVNGVAGSFGRTDNPFTGVFEGTLGNDDVTWEKERKLDLGLDLSLFNGKVTATFDWFSNYRYDILYGRGTVSSIFGQALPNVNLGKVRNEGYEAQVTYRDRIGKDVTFSISPNFSYARNKILFQDEAAVLYPWKAFTGKTIGALAVYQFIGFYNQDNYKTGPTTPVPVKPGELMYADLNQDGKIDANDQAVSDKANFPRTIAGLNMSIGYKGFSINILLQGAKDFYVRGVAEQLQAFAGNLQQIHLQAWTPELGDNAKYPVLTYGSTISDARAYPSIFWYIPGDYIRLKNAEISYELPANWIKAARLKAVRIYANGYNLVTWSKLQKLYSTDPEITSGNDRINYPPQRMYNMGLSLTF